MGVRYLFQSDRRAALAAWGEVPGREYCSGVHSHSCLRQIEEFVIWPRGRQGRGSAVGDAQFTLDRLVGDMGCLVCDQRCVPDEQAQQDGEAEFAAGTGHVRFDRPGTAGFRSL